MKATINFLKTTLVGGFLFLLPLVLTVLVMREAVQWLAKVLEPLVQFLSLYAPLGVHAKYILAVFILLLVGFLAGLVAKTGVGELFRRTLEHLILRKMPGYTLLRGIANADPAEGGKELESVLVRVAPEKYQLAFVIERHPDDWMTIFIPSAPNPTSGTVQLMSPSHIVPLRKPPKDVAMCLMKIGQGFEKLAATEAKQDSLN